MVVGNWNLPFGERERASENDERLGLGTGQGDTDAETQEGERNPQPSCSGEEEVRAAAEESGRLASARKWSRVRVLTKGQRRSAIRTVNCPVRSAPQALFRQHRPAAEVEQGVTRCQHAARPR